MVGIVCISSFILDQEQASSSISLEVIRQRGNTVRIETLHNGSGHYGASRKNEVKNIRHQGFDTVGAAFSEKISFLVEFKPCTIIFQHLSCFNE